MRGPTRLGVIMYGAAAGTIDLGDDPPLVIGNKDDEPRRPIQRAISWRWLTGTVLTGLTSIALMGAALMAALNNPNQFASLPDAFAQLTAGSSDIIFGEKGDRIRPHHEEVSSRQIIQVSTVTRQGERDFIKLRPFAKINATLTFKDDKYAKEVPPYDPMRIFADTSAPEPPSQAGGSTVAGPSDQLYGANVDGEVSVKVTPFPIDSPDLDPNAALQTAQVEQILRTATRPQIPQVADPMALGYTDTDFSSGSGDNLASGDSALGVRIVPENVSNIAKSDAGSGSGDSLEEDVIPVPAKTDLARLLKANGVAADDVDQIDNALAQLMDINHLQPDQKVRIAFATSAVPGQVAKPMRVSIYKDGVHQATVARADNNVFVRGDEPASLPAAFANKEVVTPSGGPPQLYDAVYETALEQQVPKSLVDRLIRIFAFDVDFQQRVAPGDSMEILQSLPDPADKDASAPEILYASLSLGSSVKRFYRFRTPDDGVVDYYDQNGKSAKKFLLRKPVPNGRLTSGFGYRRHPILGRMILHAGVDYAAPRGTPILAAGNGIIEKAGRSAGYGNLIVIKHTNGYETAYGHQSRFAKGIRPGVRVHQGQIIGYVGSTGLSTGPHVHFEIRINHQPVDPLRIRLPRGRVLQGEYLAEFERERHRIDALLDNGPQNTQKVAASTASLIDARPVSAHPTAVAAAAPGAGSDALTPATVLAYANVNAGEQLGNKVFDAVVKKTPVVLAPNIDPLHAWVNDPLPVSVHEPKQVKCLASAIYFEARGEPVRGQVAIAQVVLNRLKDPAFPDTICGVVYQNESVRNGCQFSFACDGLPETIDDQRAWADSKSLALKILNDKREMFLPGVGAATHYHADYVQPSWAHSMKRVDKIGSTIFYKTPDGGWS